ncbi:MAG: hypothetical protein P8Q36_01380 [Alphaproteobacteria bacterium]|nr:hypothetical protein [Alphaproteobacteria bacterium]
MLPALLVLASARAVLADTLEPLTVAVGLSLPPYVIAEERRGMEYDIVREALEAASFKMVPIFMAFGAVPEAIAAGEVEAAMTFGADTEFDVALSAVHIVYHNQAMTLASSGLAIDRIGDLEGKSILAFQNATLYLPALTAMPSPITRTMPKLPSNTARTSRSSPARLKSQLPTSTFSTGSAMTAASHLLTTPITQSSRRRPTMSPSSPMAPAMPSIRRSKP